MTSTMRTILAGELSHAHHAGVLRLWNEEYPSTLALSGPLDLDRYLLTLSGPQHFLLVADTDELYGWSCSFTRDGDVWFAMIVAGAQQGRGYGRMLMEAMRTRHDRLPGWVIDAEGAAKRNGEPYRSPLGFYLRNGFEVIPEERSGTSALSAVRMRWVR